MNLFFFNHFDHNGFNLYAIGIWMIDIICFTFNLHLNPNIDLLTDNPIADFNIKICNATDRS